MQWKNFPGSSRMECLQQLHDIWGVNAKKIDMQIASLSRPILRPPISRSEECTKPITTIHEEKVSLPGSVQLFVHCERTKVVSRASARRLAMMMRHQGEVRCLLSALVYGVAFMSSRCQHSRLKTAIIWTRSLEFHTSVCPSSPTYNYVDEARQNLSELTVARFQKKGG